MGICVARQIRYRIRIQRPQKTCFIVKNEILKSWHFRGKSWHILVQKLQIEKLMSDSCSPTPKTPRNAFSKKNFFLPYWGGGLCSSTHFCTPSPWKILAPPLGLWPKEIFGGGESHHKWEWRAESHHKSHHKWCFSKIENFEIRALSVGFCIRFVLNPKTP